MKLYDSQVREGGGGGGGGEGIKLCVQKCMGINIISIFFFFFQELPYQELSEE